jgi:hypothetical protein
VLVTAGQASYEFDPATARLVGATFGTEKLITGSRTTIWRALGPNDTVLIRARAAELPDLDEYTHQSRVGK